MGWRCLHTSIFIEALSLEGLPTKAKEDPSSYEMRLSPAGHKPSISLLLIILLLMFCISTPWKYEKTKGFLTFLMGIETEHWAKMGLFPNETLVLVDTFLGTPWKHFMLFPGAIEM